MYTNLNPRTMGLNHHPYEDLLAAAGKCGFGGIEVPAHAFGSVEKAREAGKVLESRGMKWGLMMGPCDMFRAGDEEFDKALEQWARWLERARAAGHIIISGPEQMNVTSRKTLSGIATAFRGFITL